MGGVGGGTPKRTPDHTSGNIFIMCGIMKFMVASATEAKLGKVSMNSKDMKVIRLIRMGHRQPPTRIHCDNKTAEGIANNAAKEIHRSRSLEMRFFWVTYQVKKGSLMCNGTQGRITLGIIFQNTSWGNSVSR